MCGIAGAIDADVGRAAARVSMLNDLQGHRGPDHSVVARVGGFTIGNTRLAIQDPSPSGNQPFVSTDGRYHCVYNGEIYNYRRLIERYQLPVRTACDGEVIPELWTKLGVASLAELRGMFAIALVDSLEKQLYLARDPFGIKPLHWRALPEGPIVFASEVRPLVRVAAGVRIDCEAVAQYLKFGAVAPDQAPFLEITALPPNSVAAFDRDNRMTVQSIVPGGPLRVTRPASDLGAALTDSIELHLGADVPTALLLSGGVDSATIAAVGCRLGRRLHCVTVAAEGAADESAGAAETARHYGHQFQRLHVAVEDGDVARFFGAMQRPTIDGLNTYLVSKAVHEAGFKVELSGLGGDEAVGGYAHFRLLRYLSALRAVERMPSAVTGAVASVLDRMGLASEAKARRLLGREGPRDAWGLSLLQREVLPAPLVADLTGTGWAQAADAAASGIVRSSTAFSALVAAEVAIYLQATLLPDADAFSMASSVELRVPFVDSHVFSAALGLAAGQSTPPGKAAIAAALDDPYLKRLTARPKRGFSVPMRFLMSGPLAPVLRAAEEPDAAVWSVVDRAAAESAGLMPLGPRARWAETWAIAALNAWLSSIAAVQVCP
jgi:asparagine synthase (glutamine-hydrolysing)